MATREEEVQHVVAVIGAVEALGQGRLGVVEIGQRVVRRELLLLPPAARPVGGTAPSRPADRPFAQSAAQALEGDEFAEQPGVLVGLFDRIDALQLRLERALFAWRDCCRAANGWSIAEFGHGEIGG